MVKADRWEPWEDYKMEFEKDRGEILAIPGPPCRRCAFWKPQRQYQNRDGGIYFDGLTLCHAGEMFGDFSCYRPRWKE